MTTLTFPTSPNFASARFGLTANTRIFESPFDKSSQDLELLGNRWSGTFTLPQMKLSDAANWRSFLSTLKGSSGRFFGFDPQSKTPRGLNLGTPVIAGSNQIGENINTSGWTANQNGLLLPGDYFEIGGELKQVKYGTTVNSNGTGLATINFVPSIRVSPIDTSSIITINPKTIMKLISDDQSFWEETPLFWGFTFSAIETFT